MARVLVVGSGGREHALATFLARSAGVEAVHTAPGNAGTPGNVPIEVGGGGVFGRLIDFVKERGVALTVVGPEAPLCAGLADALGAEGLGVFGPSGAAARLEGDKAFARRFMKRQGIPHPRFEVFSDLREALGYLRTRPEGPVVVKAAGLAAGKGVQVCGSRAEAQAALKRTMEEKAFGASGEQVLLEELLEGEEASVLALCDGRRALYLPSSQDHKRAFDGDRGPNTGGMGAYAPATVVSAEVLEKVERRIVQPTLQGLAEAGTPYRGCLYVGLMVRQGEPSVVEFNCRFGDPETQAVLPLLECDLYPLLLAAAQGELAGLSAPARPGAACCVVMASGGYPGQYQKGRLIAGLEEAERLEGLYVFHAGTRRGEGGQALTSGGRVLGVTGTGATIREAIDRAYAGAALIRFEGCRYRRDIGHRAMGSLEAPEGRGAEGESAWPEGPE
jgi:phosphoribosylamine--glycine ligase